ncbi:MAG: hypothetical protein ABL864_00325 [Terricaulis sp.]
MTKDAMKPAFMLALAAIMGLVAVAAAVRIYMGVVSLMPLDLIVVMGASVVGGVYLGRYLVAKGRA